MTKIYMVTVGAFHEFYGDNEGVAKMLDKTAAVDHVAISVMRDTDKDLLNLKSAGYEIIKAATRKDARNRTIAATYHSRS